MRVTELHSGYGAVGSGSGSIPPHAVLSFDVELTKIKAGSAPPNMFVRLDRNGEIGGSERLLVNE